MGNHLPLDFISKNTEKMKKMILTAAAVFSFAFVNAQERESGTIELIPQIGYSSANYYGNQVESGNNSLSGITFGLGGDYYFSDRWSIRSGILFQTMGTKLGSFEEKLNYLTVPLNANWHFGGTRKWNLNFGPSVSFLTSAETEGVDIKDAVNATQFGISIGIGYKIEVSEKISILIDYQSLTGLNNVAKDSNLTFKNGFGSFNVGGVFKL